MRFSGFNRLHQDFGSALRGAGDTRTPMWCNLVFYWLIGLPVGYLLCFHARRGAAGLWIGLCAGLVLIGSVLLLVWRAKARELQRSREAIYGPASSCRGRQNDGTAR